MTILYNFTQTKNSKSHNSPKTTQNTSKYRNGPTDRYSV